jgi:hypothetical protein
MIEIADNLLTQAKRLAARDRTSVRALVEEGPRLVVENRARPAKPFKLQDQSLRGEGRFPDLEWEKIRGLIYEGRGG